MLAIKWGTEISHVVPDKIEELSETNGSLLPAHVRSKESVYVKTDILYNKEQEIVIDLTVNIKTISNLC